MARSKRNPVSSRNQAGSSNQQNPAGSSRRRRRQRQSKPYFSRSDRRRWQRLENLGADDIAKQLKVFMDNMGAESPEGDKNLVSEWTECRGAANTLKSKHIPIDSMKKLEAVIAMKRRYGFTGKVLFNTDSPKLLSRLVKKARGADLSYNIVN